MRVFHVNVFRDPIFLTAAARTMPRQSRMAAMAEERLTEIPTIWTTISSAHIAGPQKPGGDGRTGRPVPRCRDALHPSQGPRQASGRRGPPGILDQAVDRQTRRGRQEQGTIPGLSADRAPPPDHRSLPDSQAPAASPRRPARSADPTRISTASGEKR